jgi:hypothetical protein
MEFIVPDTLVLEIVEPNQIGPVFYVLYDKNTHIYVLRCLTETQNIISFECDSEEDLINFVKVLFKGVSTTSFTLYNYDNLPALSNNITFEFLNENRPDEIVCDCDKLKKKNLLKYLRIIRNIFNYNN